MLRAALIAASMVLVPAAYSADAVTGKIMAVPRDGDTITITAFVTTLEPADVHGKLVVQRTGPSGTMSSSQASELVLAAGESAALATLSVNLPTGHAAEVALLLEVDGALVFEARQTFP